MYQLVFSIYALVLAFTTGGIPLAVSRLVAEYNARGENTRPIVKVSVLGVTIFSLLISLILVFLGKYIAILQGNADIYLGYFLIIPSIISVGIMAIFRGWFQGNLNVMPTAVSQLTEQVFKLACGLAFAKLLMPRGVLYAAYGALLGVAVSEIAALIYVAVTYVVTRKKYIINTAESSAKEAGKEVIKIGLIFAIAGFIVPFSQFIDGIVIVNILKLTGSSTASATAQYGIFSGTVTSVINMPIVLTLALAVAVVPVVSANRIERNLEGIIQKSATSIKLSYVIGLPAAILAFIYAAPVVEVLYPRLTAQELIVAARLMRISAFTILTASQREIYGSLLMALNRTGDVIKNTVLAVLLKTAVLVVALFYTGIDGAPWAHLAFGITATFLNVVSFNKLLGKNIKLVKNISTIVVSSAIMTVAAALMYVAVPKGIAAIVAGGLVSVAVYAVCLMMTKVFDEGELDGIPFSAFFERLSRKLRFWENR